MPQILACSTAVPPRRFSQAETFALSGYKSPRIRQIFLNCDIDSRHFWLNPDGFTPTESPDQLHARYREGALHLSCTAAQDALTQTNLSPQDIDCLLVASCTGYLCADLATLLAGHMPFRPDVQRGALLGHGCAGALPLLQRASDFARANPGRNVLAIAVEICSACYFLDSTMDTVIGNAICADGAAAVVLRHEESARAVRPAAPEIIAFQTVLQPEHNSKVGFEQKNGRLRIVLAAEIRDLAGPIIDSCLDRLLSPRGIRRSDVRHWVLHPGGRKVLDKAIDFLGLHEQQLQHSRDVLRNFGNMSSPTVLFVLRRFMDTTTESAPQPGDIGVMLALGPGFVAEAALLKW